MKKRLGLPLLLIIFTFRLLAGEVPQGVKENFQIIKNLEEDWLKADENNRYVPFIGKDHYKTPAIGIMLNLTRYSGNSLLCCVPQESSVLIEQQIIGYSDKEKCIRLDIDSLQQVYQKEQIFVSVYQADHSFDRLHFLVVSNNSEVKTVLQNTSHKRTGSSVRDFFIIGLLVLLASYAFQLNQFPKTFKNLYNFRKVFAFKIREEPVKIRLLNEAHIVFLLHHCLLIAYLLILSISTNSMIDLSLVVDQPQAFSEFIITWLKLSLFVFMVIWLKYMVVMMFGALFGLKNLKYIHVFDFMRMSLIFWSVIFTCIVLIFSMLSINNSLYLNLLIYIFIAFATVRIVILYYRLFTGSIFRNVYLFSYICTSEIIPLLVGLELFID